MSVTAFIALVLAPFVTERVTEAPETAFPRLSFTTESMMRFLVPLFPPRREYEWI